MFYKLYLRGLRGFCPIYLNKAMENRGWARTDFNAQSSTSSSTSQQAENEVPRSQRNTLVWRALNQAVDEARDATPSEDLDPSRLPIFRPPGISENILGPIGTPRLSRPPSQWWHMGRPAAVASPTPSANGAPGRTFWDAQALAYQDWRTATFNRDTSEWPFPPAPPLTPTSNGARPAAPPSSMPAQRGRPARAATTIFPPSTSPSPVARPTSTSTERLRVAGAAIKSTLPREEAVNNEREMDKECDVLMRAYIRKYVVLKFSSLSLWRAHDYAETLRHTLVKYRIVEYFRTLAYV